HGAFKLSNQPAESHRRPFGWAKQQEQVTAGGTVVQPQRFPGGIWIGPQLALCDGQWCLSEWHSLRPQPSRRPMAILNCWFSLGEWAGGRVLGIRHDVAKRFQDF